MGRINLVKRNRRYIFAGGIMPFYLNLQTHTLQTLQVILLNFMRQKYMKPMCKQVQATNR